MIPDGIGNSEVTAVAMKSEGGRRERGHAKTRAGKAPLLDERDVNVSHRGVTPRSRSFRPLYLIASSTAPGQSWMGPIRCSSSDIEGREIE